MSQQLTPIDGGVTQLTTTVSGFQNRVLSQVYIDVKNLHSRPTEWVPDGRPIYRRLPATSETYQVDFFNIAPSGSGPVEEVGFVYIPWGEGIFGPTSTQVVASESNETLLIKGGNIAWKYGTSPVLPTILDLEVLDVGSGKYEIAYEMLYDDSPVAHTYTVEDFLLTGLDLTVTSSTDEVSGWRYPATNAFLEDTSKVWKNEDTYFPSFAQPSSAFIQWETGFPGAYEKIVFRAPSDASLTGTASLYAVSGTAYTLLQTVSVSTDTVGSYFEFTPGQSGVGSSWRVEFSSLSVSINQVLVTGAITLQTRPSGPVPRAALVMYPKNALPSGVYASLAEVDVGSNFNVEKITDTRNIIHRDYQPVADWLTTPFDETLINMYEQVETYATTWMRPSTALLQEYTSLSTDLIEVTP